MSEPTLTVTEPQGRTQAEPVVPPVVVNANSDPKMFTQADLEAARQQEKDKVYKRMETMQETVNRLEAEATERRTAEEKARKDAADAAEADRQSQLSVQELLNEREAQWRSEQETLRQEIATERALRERETQFAELMTARDDVIAAYADRVAPELLDLISGDTPEALQQSAEDMAARTERILAQTAEAMQNARQQMPTARVTAPASGDNAGANRQFTPDEIRGMSMADYAKHRPGLLGGGAGGSRNRGMFG